MSKPMTPDQMLTALRAEGLTVREYTGWRGRCRCCPSNVPHKTSGPYVRGWGDVNGTVVHITAGNLGSRSVETYIRDIINGDPEVPSKSQFVIAPNGDVWLNSVGRCNHVGTVGGSVRAHLTAADFSTSDDYDSRWRGTATDGNSFTYGIENIAASKMTAAQRESSVRVCAAIARHFDWSGQESVGHGEVSGQRTKADPNLHMGQFRRDVMARVKSKPNTNQEDTMALSNDELDRIAFKVAAYKNKDLETRDRYQIERDTDAAVKRVEAKVDKVIEALGKE